MKCKKEATLSQRRVFEIEKKKKRGECGEKNRKDKKRWEKEGESTEKEKEK